MVPSVFCHRDNMVLKEVFYFHFINCIRFIFGFFKTSFQDSMAFLVLQFCRSHIFCFSSSLSEADCKYMSQHSQNMYRIFFMAISFAISAYFLVMNGQVGFWSDRQLLPVKWHIYCIEQTSCQLAGVHTTQYVIK